MYERILVYMDLTGAIVKKDTETKVWRISTDTGDEYFKTDDDVMNFIDEELEEIKKAYERNGEMDELIRIYAENCLEV